MFRKIWEFLGSMYEAVLAGVANYPADDRGKWR